MEIKKIFYFLLALYIWTAKAENRRTNDEQIKMNPMIVFPQDDTKTKENKTVFNTGLESQQAFKTNSRDSFKIINGGPEIDDSFKNHSGFLGASFNAKLFEILSLSAHQKNLVFSPISLYTLLAFIYTMSDGKLFNELSVLLEMPKNQTHVARVFEDLLEKASSKAPHTTLIMANKLYYDYHLGAIDNCVRNLAENSFASELEEIDFVASTRAANIINAWIREKTRNLIQNIVTPSSLTADTQALLLNSIYFKSRWLKKFDTEDIEVQPFHVTRSRQIPVDMMYNEDVFRYGDFTEDLQASAVELPYNVNNLTMWLILPKDVEGLAELERKLRFYDLQMLERKLKRETVIVKLPKFEIEFETDMTETLQKMGLNALFNNEGVISLFKNQQKPLKVDQLKHKAFIRVNEDGTEAAVVSVANYVPLSIPHNIKYFIADHPFVFIIRDGNTILFMGHVTKF